MQYDPTDYHFFWQTTSPFSNWHAAHYVLDDNEFNCTEQGVMWEKAKLFGDENIALQIKKCGQTEQALMKKLGRQVRGFNERIWKKNRVEIYKRHCLAKFSQNPHLKTQLMNTSGKMLVEASPSDKIWGIGMAKHEAIKVPPHKWKGLNLLGLILTDIRTEFENIQES